MKTIVTKELQTPSQSQMEYWIGKWDEMVDYVEQEKALNRIFKNDAELRLNTKLDAVLLKCSVLNDFYSTKIYKIYLVAKWIVDPEKCGDVDARLHQGDPSLVDDIAAIGGRKFNLPGREDSYIMPRIYSFATKFCSHHNEDAYPIYDSYVHRVLHYYNISERFTEIGTHLYLRKCDIDADRHYVPLCDKYKNFVTAMGDFRNRFGLNAKRGFKDVDRYLWQLGKDAFPKDYGRHMRLLKENA